jgi:hypothetical protein
VANVSGCTISFRFIKKVRVVKAKSGLKEPVDFVVVGTVVAVARGGRFFNVKFASP